MSDWKPGDVAIASGERVVLTQGQAWLWVLTGVPCHTQPPSGIRPLVVIDPEDGEAVERLEADLDARHGWTHPCSETRVDALQAALREFANPKPPKPDEPTGLGAVVEDDRGRRWVRDHDGFWSSNLGSHQWQSLHGYDARIVRVLSEGVQP